MAQTSDSVEQTKFLNAETIFGGRTQNGEFLKMELDEFLNPRSPLPQAARQELLELYKQHQDVASKDGDLLLEKLTWKYLVQVYSLLMANSDVMKSYDDTKVRDWSGSWSMLDDYLDTNKQAWKQWYAILIRMHPKPASESKNSKGDREGKRRYFFAGLVSMGISPYEGKPGEYFLHGGVLVRKELHGLQVASDAIAALITRYFVEHENEYAKYNYPVILMTCALEKGDFQPYESSSYINGAMPKLFGKIQLSPEGTTFPYRKSSDVLKTCWFTRESNGTEYGIFEAMARGFHNILQTQSHLEILEKRKDEADNFRNPDELSSMGIPVSQIPKYEIVENEPLPLWKRIVITTCDGDAVNSIIQGTRYRLSAELPDGEKVPCEKAVLCVYEPGAPETLGQEDKSTTLRFREECNSTEKARPHDSYYTYTAFSCHDGASSLQEFDLLFTVTTGIRKRCGKPISLRATLLGLVVCDKDPKGQWYRLYESSIQNINSGPPEKPEPPRKAIRLAESGSLQGASANQDAQQRTGISHGRTDASGTDSLDYGKHPSDKSNAPRSNMGSYSSREAVIDGGGTGASSCSLFGGQHVDESNNGELWMRDSESTTQLYGNTDGHNSCHTPEPSDFDVSRISSIRTEDDDLPSPLDINDEKESDSEYVLSLDTIRRSFIVLPRENPNLQKIMNDVGRPGAPY